MDRRYVNYEYAMEISELEAAIRQCKQEVASKDADIARMRLLYEDDMYYKAYGWSGIMFAWACAFLVFAAYEGVSAMGGFAFLLCLASLYLCAQAEPLYIDDEEDEEEEEDEECYPAQSRT